MRQLEIGRASAGRRQRHTDLCQHFIWLDGGRVEIDKKAIRRYSSAARCRLQYKRSVERGEDHGEIRSWIGVGDTAADGAAITHLQIPDYRCGIRQTRQMLPHQLSRRDVGVYCESTN